MSMCVCMCRGSVIYTISKEIDIKFIISIDLDIIICFVNLLSEHSYTKRIT